MKMKSTHLKKILRNSNKRLLKINPKMIPSMVAVNLKEEA
jgi:hypothetical protein